MKFVEIVRRRRSDEQVNAAVILSEAHESARSRRTATQLRGLMENEAQGKILQLLDVISGEVAANRNETSELRDEMRAGFGRVERRLGNLEIRVENVETRLGVVETRLDVVGTELRSFRGEFERRIAPLER